MNSVEALDFAIRRLEVDRHHFVHREDHNAAILKLRALREALATRQLLLKPATERQP